MKILSKYKDYYDFLSGIYGVDPNLILDRRVFDNYELWDTKILIFHICGKIYEGYYSKENDKFYYGNALLKLGKMGIKYINGGSRWSNLHKNVSAVIISNNKKYRYWEDNNIKIALEPYIDEKNINIKENCPILLANGIHFLKFPLLSKYNFGSMLKAEEIYQNLVEYLSNEKTKLEVYVDDRTDVEKLQSKGFDKKESFRGTIK